MPNMILENSGAPQSQELLSTLNANTLLPTVGFATLCNVNLPVGTWDITARMSVTGVNATGTINLYVGVGGNGEQIVGTLTMRAGVAGESGVSGVTRIVATSPVICTLRSSNFSSGFGAVSALPYDPATGSGTFLLAKSSTAIAAPSLRTLNAANLLTNLILQASLQSAYDSIVGTNAPDTATAIPAAVVAAANALNDSNWKLYLGHNAWYYTSFTNTATVSNWSLFGGSKSNFAALVPANHIFTFK